MSGGIAHYSRDRVAPVAFHHVGKTVLDFGECFLPGRFDEAAVALDKRHTQPIGVLVQVLERRALRADETPAEDIIRIGADTCHLAVTQLELEAAASFTE